MAPTARDDTDDEDEDISIVGEIASPEKRMQQLTLTQPRAGRRALLGKREAEENRLNQILFDAGIDPSEIHDIMDKRVSLSK